MKSINLLPPNIRLAANDDFINGPTHFSCIKFLADSTEQIILPSSIPKEPKGVLFKAWIQPVNATD